MKFVLFILAIALSFAAVHSQREDSITVIRIVHSNRTVNGFTQEPWYAYEGSGEHWTRVTNGDIHDIFGYETTERLGFNVAYKNEIDEFTTFHLHGQSPAPYLDGVPFLGTNPLYPGRMARVSYPFYEVDSAGTYWIHAHVGLQLSLGAFCPVIVYHDVPDNYPNAVNINNARSIFVVLEDFCPYVTAQTPEDQVTCNIEQVVESLSGIRNISGADYICPGAPLGQERPILFQQYLFNYQPINNPERIRVRRGEWIHLRFLNAASMTHFQIQLPFQGTIIATDGQLTQPHNTNSFWIAAAHRIDLVWRVPTDGGAWAIIAQGEDFAAPQFAGIILYTANYRNVRSIDLDTLPTTPVGFMGHATERVLRAFHPIEPRPVDRYLDVNMTQDFGLRINGFDYFLTTFADFVPNQHPLHVIFGERVHLILRNHSPVNHPMHLHGHRQQVVRIDDETLNGPWRDTVLVEGACHEIEIAIDAINSGIWAFHCHMHYHFEGGMLTTLEYIPRE